MSITTLHNDSQQNDTRPNNKNAKLGITSLSVMTLDAYAYCRYVQCRICICHLCWMSLFSVSFRWLSVRPSAICDMSRYNSQRMSRFPKPGNTRGGRITVPLTSCLTGLESALWELTIFAFICKTVKSKPVKQEVNGTVILPPLVFPVQNGLAYFSFRF